MKIFYTKKGFTLVEIMVSLAIFSLVMVVALGAFLKIVDVNKRAQSIESAVNSLTFVIEAMSREIRTGKEYQLDANGTFTFIGKYDTNNMPIYYGYKKVGDVIQKTTSNTRSGLTYSNATPNNVLVKKFDISLIPNETPLVNIYVAGEVGLIEKAKSTFDIQTSVSQRLK